MAYSLSKICKIFLEYTLKCSQLISSSDNKKILLTTRNVRLDSGHYATKYYFYGAFVLQMWKQMKKIFVKTQRVFYETFVKFVYSKKATQADEIFIVDLTFTP